MGSSARGGQLSDHLITSIFFGAAARANIGRSPDPQSAPPFRSARKCSRSSISTPYSASAAAGAGPADDARSPTVASACCGLSGNEPPPSSWSSAGAYGRNSTPSNIAFKAPVARQVARFSA